MRLYRTHHTIYSRMRALRTMIQRLFRCMALFASLTAHRFG